MDLSNKNINYGVKFLNWDPRRLAITLGYTYKYYNNS